MRLRTVLVVGLMAATVLVNPLRAEPATPNPYSVKLGMAQGPNPRALSQAAFAGAKDVGATWTRLSFSWRDIEETRGVFTWAGRGPAGGERPGRGRGGPGHDHVHARLRAATPIAPINRARRLRPCTTTSPASRRRSRPGTRARSTPGRSGTNPTRPASGDPQPDPAGYARAAGPHLRGDQAGQPRRQGHPGGPLDPLHELGRLPDVADVHGRLLPGRRGEVRRLRHPPVLRHQPADVPGRRATPSTTCRRRSST